MDTRKWFKRIEDAQVEASENIALLTRAMIASDKRMTRIEDAMTRTQQDLTRIEQSLYSLVKAITADRANGKKK